jgi:hypothetical protein
MDKFDEYKFFAESTQWLTGRRQAATQTYLGVATAIFAVIGFLFKDGGLRGWDLVVLSAPLVVVGMLVCWIWYKLIMNYKKIINFRYDELMKMEGDIDGCHKMYCLEYEKLYDPGKKFGFSVLERWLPRFFIILFIAFLIVLILAVKCKWFGV